MKITVNNFSGCRVFELVVREDMSQATILSDPYQLPMSITARYRKSFSTKCRDCLSERHGNIRIRIDTDSVPCASLRHHFSGRMHVMERSNHP